MQANAVAEQIRAFSNDNALVDAAAARQMGDPIQYAVTNVEIAAGKLTAAWQAVADDLSCPVSFQSRARFCFLRSWANLRNEAEGYAAIAPAQQKYLDAGWEEGLASAAARWPPG